ncbi:DUF4416 family protein [Bremerella cremea]|uniref:DUF4416 domain-containing protein n=1 Tax=Blastopirellula marina TaxID=124 RepID=A0A2S8FRL1_9BACT|nr:MULTISPECIES: DUF4416 family protein [Pirellulaceae]PQO34815.1 DUF4416 domain-containing protein [Blastopirellula marina]RCS47315.1 DUF4416 family protein [Bremerella cremea]
MGDISTPRPVLRIVAAFSCYPDSLAWGAEFAEKHWGPIELKSEPFLLTETTYYDQEMGPGQSKQFWAFADLQSSGDLPDWKRESNLWEEQHAQERQLPVERPLNLDPGYISEAKLVLATTKDRDHRIYLRDGIYAEVTLHYRRKAWEAWPWTYPDYQRPEFHEFFNRCREYLRNSLQSA